MNKKDFKSIFVKFDDKRAVSHQLFIKQHNVREETKERPSDLTLFICNVPPYCTKEYLMCIFEKYGTIKDVHFANVGMPNEAIRNDHHSYYPNLRIAKGYKIGYLVFDSVKSLLAVLSLEDGATLSSSLNENVAIEGLRAWCVMYNSSFPNRFQMQEEIEAFITEHDETEERDKILAKIANESNENGWIAVSKRSRNPGFARKQSLKERVVKRMERKKKKKALLNFYNFQIKESKMNHLVTLRKKFEDDKRKLEALKMQRKFEPF